MQRKQVDNELVDRQTAQRDDRHGKQRTKTYKQTVGRRTDSRAEKEGQRQTGERRSDRQLQSQAKNMTGRQRDALTRRTGEANGRRAV